MQVRVGNRSIQTHSGRMNKLKAFKSMSDNAFALTDISRLDCVKCISKKLNDEIDKCFF